MQTTTSQLDKGHAQLALNVLDHFVVSILEPHWTKKLDKLPEQHQRDNVGQIYQAHIIKARTALFELRSEVGRMPGCHE